ncbi:MAG: hypothetical protein ACOC1P_00610 [Minisyncoccales bacterium]
MAVKKKATAKKTVSKKQPTEKKKSNKNLLVGLGVVAGGLVLISSGFLEQNTNYEEPEQQNKTSSGGYTVVSGGGGEVGTAPPPSTNYNVTFPEMQGFEEPFAEDTKKSTETSQKSTKRKKEGNVIDLDKKQTTSKKKDIFDKSDATSKDRFVSYNGGVADTHAQQSVSLDEAQRRKKQARTTSLFTRWL